MEITTREYFWQGVSPKGTVFIGAVHVSKQPKNTERRKTVGFTDQSLIHIHYTFDKTYQEIFLNMF